MKRVLILSLFFACIIGAGRAEPAGFLRAQEGRIVDAQGREVILRGMGLGGWMLQEGYMLGINREGAQHSIKARITDLVGKEDCDKFYQLWRQNHMGRADVDLLAQSGFNSIRVPMHYNLFTLPIEEEPVEGGNTWLEPGFAMLDNLLGWCKANRMYLILDLHAAPGGQGKDANISDYDPAKPSLWESDLNRQKTIALWRKLAERYAREPWIGGYDLLNEPNWTFEGKDKNGREDTRNQPLWELYQAISKAVREVDTNHIVIIEGNGWGNNYNGFPGPWDSNMVLSFHKYWNPNTQEAIARFLALREKHRVPLWLGESGENNDQWFRDCVALVEKNHIGWAWWPHKKVNSGSCTLTIRRPDDFRNLVEYWNRGGERPSREIAAKAFFQLAENAKAENCRFNANVVQALIPPATARGGRYVKVDYPASTATNELQIAVTYTLWIPEGAPRLRGLIVHQHGAGTTASIEGSTAACDLHWQALARKWDCALLGPSYHVLNEKTDLTPGGSEWWFDPRRGSEKTFFKALSELAAKSGHPELETIPWVLWGHSGGGIWSERHDHPASRARGRRLAALRFDRDVSHSTRIPPARGSCGGLWRSGDVQSRGQRTTKHPLARPVGNLPGISREGRAHWFRARPAHRARMRRLPLPGNPIFRRLPRVAPARQGQPEPGAQAGGSKPRLASAVAGRRGATGRGVQR